MEKRLIGAVGVSLIVLLLVTFLSPRKQASDEGSAVNVSSVDNSSGADSYVGDLGTDDPAKESVQTETSGEDPSANSQQQPDLPEFSDSISPEDASPWSALPRISEASPEEIVVSNDLYEISFTTAGAIPTSWKLTKYHESFRDPRYLELRSKKPLMMDGRPIEPAQLRGWFLNLYKYKNDDFALPARKETFDLNIDHLAYQDYLAYAQGERGADVSVRGGQTSAPVNIASADFTGPFAGLAMEWGDRPDETILYKVDRDHIRIGNSPEKLVFRTETDTGFCIEKRLTFHPGRYMIDVEIEFFNRSGKPIQFNGQSKFKVLWRGGLGRPSTAQDLQNGVHVCWGEDVQQLAMLGNFNKIEEELLSPERGLVDFSKSTGRTYAGAISGESRRYETADEDGAFLNWIAVDSKYFAAAIVPKEPSRLATLGFDYIMATDRYFIRPEVGVSLALPDELAAGSTRPFNFTLYAGPKEGPRLEAVSPTLEEISDTSFMSSFVRPISKFMLYLLGIFYKIVPNYGVCIVFLTLVVKAAMLPLYHKQQISMKKMQAMQPQMNALKEQYKNDPQRLQRETMEFYRRNKINPASGCLMMLPMMPIFIALWITFNNSIELRGAGFINGWIDDLSKPDNAFFIPLGDWIIPINILPMLYAIAMFWSQSRQMSADNPNANVMKFIPFIFVFIFWNFASGVLLYFVVSFTIDTIQRLVMDALGIGDVTAPATGTPADSAATAAPVETGDKNSESRSMSGASVSSKSSARGKAKGKKK